MDPVRWLRPVELRRARAIVAFEGWNDACDAATDTVTLLIEQLGEPDPFAVVEPEEFFDFQQQRPSVAIDDGGVRRISWPETRFHAASLDGLDHDLVLVVGVEPHLRWRTFARTVARTLADAGVEEVLLLGAYIGQVSHRPPVPLAGAATDPASVALHGLEASDYEGPTGIVGVLLEACQEAGLEAISIWAATPPYLAASANPTAVLALTERTAAIYDLPVRLDDLAMTAAEFIRRVDEAVSESDDLAEYLDELGIGIDDLHLDERTGRWHGPGAPAARDDRLDPDRTADLVNEIERFLEDQA